MHITQRLDDLGRPAWIGLLVLSFIIFPPAGLLLLGFLFWSGRMSCMRYGHGFEGRGFEGHGFDRHGWRNKMREARARWHNATASSGNRAFDEYRDETLRRLEDEQREFREFLDRLRHAKDKAEFDQFMSDRRRPPAPPADTTEI